MRSVAVTFADRGTTISRFGKIASDAGVGELSGRLLTRSALSLANSPAFFDRATAGFGALAVGLPEAIVVADLGSVVGGVALRISCSTLDCLVAVRITSRSGVASVIR